MTQNNEREALISDAKEAGFINHPIHGLVVRHSNGSWISIAEKLEKFTTLQLARAISQNEQTKQIPDGWKPIETAPKDGTQVLINCTGGRISTAFYDDKPFVGEGWHVVVPFLGGFGSGTDTFIYFPEDMPTHWMPLPAPTTSLTSETNTEVGE